MAACSTSASHDSAAAELPAYTGPVFPLDEYLASILGTDLSEEERQQQIERDNQRREELITQCMFDAGFEYHSPEQVGWAVENEAARELARPDDLDWVTQWGYRITYMPTTQAIQIISGSNLDSDMTPGERAAFQRALFGPPCAEVGEIQDNGTCIFPIGAWGCQGQATQQLLDESPSGLQLVDEFVPLFEAIAQMREELRENVAPEEIDWAACMADNGFSGFERRNNPASFMSYPETQIWEDYARIVTDYGRNSPELTALENLEIEMAITDLNCRVQVNYQARQDATRIAAETQFVADHRSQLEAIRAAAEQRG